MRILFSFTSVYHNTSNQETLVLVIYAHIHRLSSLL